MRVKEEPVKSVVPWVTIGRPRVPEPANRTDPWTVRVPVPPIVPVAEVQMSWSVIVRLPLPVKMPPVMERLVSVESEVIDNEPRLIGEVVGRKGTTKDAVEEFRNQFPDHGAELQVFGDASGRNKSGQTARTDYQLIMEALRGYSAQVRLMIPSKNPPVRDRINNVNRILRGEDGIGPAKVDVDYCQFLIDDFLNSQWDKHGKDLHKVSDPEDPAAEWTHGTDAVGYWWWRLFPFVRPAHTRAAQMVGRKDGRAKPLVYKRIAGDA